QPAFSGTGAGSTISFVFPEPNVLLPGCSQKRPATVSHPRSERSSFSCSFCHCWICAIYGSCAHALAKNIASSETAITLNFIATFDCKEDGKEAKTFQIRTSINLMNSAVLRIQRQRARHQLRTQIFERSAR